MIRRKVIHFFLFIIFGLAVACTARKEHHENHETNDSATSDDTWKEMDEFHMVMAESFHPYKDSADLGPARTKAALLSAAAEKWLNAPLPEKVNNEQVKNRLRQLQIDAQAFVEIAKTGDDKVAGESLTKLHDLFHELQETWYGGHQDHKEDH